MNILFLSLRGNIIGDSVREIALAKKVISDYSKKHNVSKDKIKIYYPCGSLIYELFKENKFLTPILIPELDDLNKTNVLKLKKLFLIFKASIQIIEKLNKTNVEITIYLGNLYRVRKYLAQYVAFRTHSKFLRKRFEEAKGFSSELFFNKNEEAKIKKYLKGRVSQRVVICTEVTEEKREWPIENYLKVIHFLLKNQYIIYLVGINKEKNKLLIDFFYKNKQFINLIAKLNIVETSLIIKNSKLFIGNDSGLAHIAAAVKIQNIIINNVNGNITLDRIFSNKATKVSMLKNPNLNQVLSEINKIKNAK